MNNGYNFFNDFDSDEVWSLLKLLAQHNVTNTYKVFEYLIDSSIDEGSSQTTFGNILLKVSNTIEHSGSGEHHSMESDTTVHLYGKGGVLLAEICYTIGSTHRCESQLLWLEVILEEKEDKLNKTIDTQETKGDNMASLSTRVNVELPTNTNVSLQFADKFCNTNTNKKDKNMTVKILNITLINENTNLTTANKVVFQALNVLTEHSNDDAKMDLIASGDVMLALNKHNAKRIDTVNQAILENTGREVMLKPIELLSDPELTWSIVTIG